MLFLLFCSSVFCAEELLKVAASPVSDSGGLSSRDVSPPRPPEGGSLRSSPQVTPSRPPKVVDWKAIAMLPLCDLERLYSETSSLAARIRNGEDGAGWVCALTV